MRKKLVASLLCGALAAGLLVCPAGAAFPDVTDPKLAQAVELLHQLEVVHGKPDGTFDPQGTFTRAEFCKMALVVLDREQEVQLHQSRVIFSDVTASHWALGYVNAAAAVREGVVTLVQGKGDGTFAPDAPITCGEAVTILMRCLGYSDKDVGGDGGAWYSGHMLRAKSIGLMDGLESLSGGDTLTRAQAALLFENLLYTETKDSQKMFFETVLGGSVGESQLVLEVKGKALAAGGWAVKTDKASYVTFRSDLDSALLGKRCKPILDKEGNLLALQVDEEHTTRTHRILSAEARYMVTDQDSQLLVDASTPVWRASGSQSTYGEAYKEITYGANAVLCYDKTDTLVSIYLTGGSPSAVTAVAKEGSLPFDKAWTGQPTAVYKNGVSASLASVKPYDVGTYDPHTGVLEVSDRKLTGVYENAAPSPVSPNTVTVMGCAFPVLDSALTDLTAFSLGDRVTLLLDGQNNVAGVVSPDKVSAPALGVATVTKGEVDEYGDDIYTAKVELSWGLTLQGRVRRVSQNAMDSASGKLYAVTATRLGYLDLTTPSSDGISGDWNVADGTIGGVKVAPQAVVYDKVPDGPLTRLKLSAVTMSTVPSRKISFLHKDGAGYVDLIVLDDCTGEGYTYGRVSFQPGYYSTDMGSDVPATTKVTNGKGSLALATGSTYSTMKNRFMGLAPSLSTLNGQPRLGASVSLSSMDAIPRSAFGDTSVKAGDQVFPLADNIDQCCFNAVSETWFGSLDDALAYASTLTIYYDKAPDQGGKVRLVVAQ